MSRLFAILAFIAVFAAAALPAQAQSEDNKATHAWADTGNSSVYAPLSTKEGCEILARQVAIMEKSSRLHCYNRDIFLMEVHCQRRNTKSMDVECTTSATPTR